MNSHWTRTDRRARITRRDEAAPARRVALGEAQPRVNFVAQVPRRMPARHGAGETTLRPEQPPGRPDRIEAAELGQTPWSEGNPCSLRTVWHAGDRSLRMKQFLYDWAPPAAGIAPLWNSPSISARPCGDGIGFAGVDYLGNRGACIQLDRTQVELSVLGGTYDDAELLDVLAALEPAAPEAAAAVRAAAWHDLSYWVRYRLPPYRVPYGLWRCSRRRPYEREGKILRGTFPPTWGGVRIPATDDLVPDSAFELESEIELRWRLPGRPHDHLIMLIDRTGEDSALPFPPEPESQAMDVRAVRSVRGHDVYLAGLTTAFGAYECRWRQGDADVALLGSASVHLTAARLLDFVPPP